MKKSRIIWSPIAEESYLQILRYLLENWSVREAQEFDNKLENLLESLKIHNRLCPASKTRKNLRRCVITPQTSLIYQIKNDQIIELVAFLDNRIDHKF
jgi:plasmid stabilization system protein ParE